jgi:acyl-CoA synthetase (AMP-forming)/AMP-acid ligase II
MSTLAFADRGATNEDLCTSIGRFDPRFEVRIADTDNSAVAPGVVGEIQARGDCVMRGYWGDEEATRAAHTSDGWLKTGDLALSRTDGLVELKGRLSEMIKSGGYNLYPREIEMVLEAHPAIAEVAVVGCPDAVFGETAHAIVSTREPVTSEALKAWCAKSLANYKTPRSFRAIDTLPRLPNGKIDRASLKGVADRLSTIP